MPRLALPVVTLAFVALSVWLARLDLNLRNETTPNGIVSFELAGTEDAAARILDSWSPKAREVAMLIQGLDFLYLLVYPTFLSLLSWRLGTRLGGTWERVGTSVGTGVWLCAPFDAVENQALIAQLMNGASESMAHRAYLAAVPKFVFFAVAVAFALGAGAAVLLRRGGRAV